MMESSSTNPSKLFKALFIAGCLIGVADGLAAIISANLSRGVTPDRVFQYVASGAIGREAFTGGMPTVLLGVFFHFIIAILFTSLFFSFAGKRQSLLTSVLLSGACYGVFVWLIMNFIVIPLSQISAAPFNYSQVLIGLFIHIFVIGIPIVWLAKQYFIYKKINLFY